MAEFKMAAIIKLSQNEWVKFVFVQMVGARSGVRVFLSEYERKITIMSESKMAVSKSNITEFKMAAHSSS